MRKLHTDNNLCENRDAWPAEKFGLESGSIARRLPDILTTNDGLYGS
jgi:hypothetical protein